MQAKNCEGLGGADYLQLGMQGKGIGKQAKGQVLGRAAQ